MLGKLGEVTKNEPIELIRASNIFLSYLLINSFVYAIKVNLNQFNLYLNLDVLFHKELGLSN